MFLSSALLNCVCLSVARIAVPSIPALLVRMSLSCCFAPAAVT